MASRPFTATEGGETAANSAQMPGAGAVLYGRDVERAGWSAHRCGEGVAQRRAHPSRRCRRGQDCAVGGCSGARADMQVLGAAGLRRSPSCRLLGFISCATGAAPARAAPRAAGRSAARSVRARAHRAGRFLISVACLTLLSELAETRPVLCLVDDAQWLDASSADALMFVARRLDAEGIVMLFAARDGRRSGLRGARDPRAGGERARRRAPRPRCHRGGGGGGVAPAVRDVLVEQAGGNALALVELPKALSATQLAGVEPLPDDLPLSRNVERVFRERVRRLPDATQQVLSLVAAEGSGGWRRCCGPRRRRE